MRPRIPIAVERMILEDYQRGDSSTTIAARHGVSFATVCRYLNANGVVVRGPRKVSVDDVVTRYMAGASADVIAKELGVTSSCIRQTLQPLGLMRSLRAAHPTLPCDDAYFDAIDTEQRAYWLGFIAADGCVGVRRTGAHRLYIGLSVVDSAHLDAFRTDINSVAPISLYEPSRSVKLVVGSERLATALMSHGVVPRKSLALRFPTTVPEHLIRHYIRGYFDGDGSIFTSGTHANVTFAGTPEFLRCVQAILNTNAVAKSAGRGTIVGSRCWNPQTVSLRYGKAAIRSIYLYFYDGATRFLPRKHERFLSVLAS